MSLTVVGFILAALTAYSYMFVRRSGYIQQAVLIPFLYKIHSPSVVHLLSEEEHEGIHSQVDIFNFRILSVFLAAIISVGVAALFLMLVSNGGAPGISGYILAVGFAYVCANYDLNAKIITWVHLSENELLGRVLQKKVDNSEYDNLGDYLKAENEKMLVEWTEELKKVGDEFERRMLELGYDDDRDYMESPEAEEELVAMLEQVSREFAEKYPETHDL